METLQIGGVSARQLADDFGTPLYVYDEDKIIAQVKDAMENFSSDMFKTEVAYASKAFSSIALFKLLAAQGLGFDAVSGGELYGMSRAGVDMSKVYFHGNNKSNKEIEEALELGVGYFVIDNVMECRRLIEIAMEKHIQTKALLRVNPGISAHTHEYIMTAKPDSKFGIFIDDTEHIGQVIELLAESSHVRLAGFHSHIGSQIMDARSFEKAIDTMTYFLAYVQREYGMEQTELSIGGGFGIKYLEEDQPISLGQMCKTMVKYTERCIQEKDISISKLITEPGRAMVGEAGYTLYTIGDRKRSGTKDYLFVDGGMSDNIRPALYDAGYRAVLAEKYKEPAWHTYCIAGKNCESGDVLIDTIKLPEAKSGDLLAVYSTGAYGYSMASNYNRLGRPAVVFAGHGKARVVIRRESYADQYDLEIE